MIPALIAGGSAALGAWYQTRGARKEARRQESFQERMSGSAAQRAVEDFRAAGLNPALAYGHQASTPGGAAAPVEDVGGRGVSTAMQAKQERAQRKLMSVQEIATREQANAAHEQAQLNFESAFKARAERHTIQRLLPLLEASTAYDAVLKEAHANEAMARMRHTNAQTDLSLFGMSRARRESEYWSGTGGAIAPWISTGRDAATGLSSLFGPVLLSRGLRGSSGASAPAPSPPPTRIGF